MWSREELSQGHYRVGYPAGSGLWRQVHRDYEEAQSLLMGRAKSDTEVFTCSNLVTLGFLREPPVPMEPPHHLPWLEKKLQSSQVSTDTPVGWPNAKTYLPFSSIIFISINPRFQMPLRLQACKFWTGARGGAAGQVLGAGPFACFH